MSLIPATRHLARRIGPLASQVTKRWISVQQLDDQQAGGSNAFFGFLKVVGVCSAERYAPITLYTRLSRVYMHSMPYLQWPMSVIFEVERPTECRSHNNSATLCAQCLNGITNITFCRSDASRCAWFRMGRILAPPKPSYSTLSTCRHLSKTLLCFYASPRLYKRWNARTPNCPGKRSRS